MLFRSNDTATTEIYTWYDTLSLHDALPICRATPKYSDSSSRTTSGSRDSDSGVNPARSQNSTEHTRRSATGTRSRPRAAAADAGVVPDDAGARSDSWCPQDRQNGFPGVTGSPHDGHRPKGAPQSSQNRSPSPRDAPHRGHVTTRHLYPGQAHPAR